MKSQHFHTGNGFPQLHYCSSLSVSASRSFCFNICVLHVQTCCKLNKTKIKSSIKLLLHSCLLNHFHCWNARTQMCNTCGNDFWYNFSHNQLIVKYREQLYHIQRVERYYRYHPEDKHHFCLTSELVACYWVSLVHLWETIFSIWPLSKVKDLHSNPGFI